MNNRIRQQAKALFRRENPEYFATIRENGVTLAQFVPRSEINEYKARYGDKIEFWEEVRDNGQVNRR